MEWKLITRIHTHHTTVDTQLNKRPNLLKVKDDSNGTLKTAASENNKNEARGVCNDHTEHKTSEVRSVGAGLLRNMEYYLAA